MKTVESLCLNANPVVTVAMSVLNGGDYLELAVQSIVMQSMREWELIILDDGSTDDAIEKLLNLGDPRIIVIRDGLNKGLSARLNQAVAMARGRYFARMDHDDISHPSRLAEQVAFLERYPIVDLVATKCVTIDEMNQPLGTLPFASDHREICARPWMGFPMPHPSWMGKLSWFRRHHYQDPAPYCCEDNELLLRAHTISVYHAIEPAFLAYRVRRHTPWRKLWRTRKAMATVQINYFLERGDYRAVALSWAVTALRVLCDLSSEIRCKTWFVKQVNGVHDADAEWVEHINTHCNPKRIDERGRCQ